MKSSKEKQDQRKAEMQAAAERDGFETWSQALTAWKNGEARLRIVSPLIGLVSQSKKENQMDVVFYFMNDGTIKEVITEQENNAIEPGSFSNYWIGKGETVEEAWKDAEERDEFISRIQAG